MTISQCESKRERVGGATICERGRAAHRVMHVRLFYILELPHQLVMKDIRYSIFFNNVTRRSQFLHLTFAKLVITFIFFLVRQNPELHAS